MENLTDIRTIKAVIARHGFTFSKGLGQNFLTDESVPEQIAEESLVDENTGAVEIGPGIGTLTASLCKRAKKVVAVELDKRLLPVLADTMADYDNFKVINADALKTDFAKLIEEEMTGLRPVLCANLPYYITTPIITSLLESKAPFETMTFMVQKEVAQRICASPASKAYGAITAMVQYYSRAEMLFDVPASSFIPAPKVDSAVVKLTVYKQPPFQVRSAENMFRLVKASFAQRRKTLVNALLGGLGGGFSKQQIEQAITAIGFDTNIRGECLSIEDFGRLSDVLYEKK